MVGHRAEISIYLFRPGHLSSVMAYAGHKLVQNLDEILRTYFDTNLQVMGLEGQYLEAVSQLVLPIPAV